jgi:hypothetical protein
VIQSGMTIHELTEVLKVIQSRLISRQEKEAIYLAVSLIKEHVLLKSRLKDMVKSHQDLQEANTKNAVQEDLFLRPTEVANH